MDEQINSPVESAVAGAAPAPAQHPVPVDRISELYRGEIFSDADIRMARDRIHWMCAQCHGELVLDVGCSQGIASILLAREGFSVTAIDVHPESVAFARAEWARETPVVQSRLSILETDLASLAEGPQFDTVLLGEVIEHQARPQRLLRAALSRLHAGGRMVVTTPFALHPHSDHKVSLFPADLVRFARELGMGVTDLHVDGSYMRCVYHVDPGLAAPYPELQDLLDRTQAATLEAERRLFDLLHERDKQLAKKTGDHKITQRKLAEATTAAEEKFQALRITQRKLAEATTAAEGKSQALESTQRELAEAKAAAEEKFQALRITQRKLAEATTAAEGKSQALESTQRELAEAKAAAEEKFQALRITQRKLAEATTAAEGKSQALESTQRELAEAKAAAEEKFQALRITQRKLAEATTAAEGKSQALESTQRELAEARNAVADQQRTHRQDLEAASRSLEESAKANRRQQAELDAAGRGLRQTGAQLAAAKQLQQRLERSVEVRDARLQAIQRRASALAERNERIVASESYRVGAALVAAARSPARLLRLPAEIWTIYRGATRRGAAERANSKATPVEPARLAEPPPSTVAPVQRLPAPEPRATTGPVAPAADREPPSLDLPSDPKRLKVASVMDEFTFHSFAPECNLMPLRPQTWEAQLAEFAPDLVFIESAWRGADDLWTKKVSNPSPEIMGVIAWCARNDVPSVFWNKEDPVHFGSFQHIAKAVDYVFTTDVDCIARYKRDLGHDRVYLLPFAAQPAVHNPIELFERRDAFCFAGSYYLKYPERQRDFKSLMDVVSQLRPVEIFDRNYHKPHPHYEFPPEYEKYIVGSLPFDQIDKAYKGYRFGINMNTIKQSQTMFARRVFELLACNTVVVSNFSRGVRLLFGDLVVCSDAQVELERRLTALCADETQLRKFRLAGVRKVMAEHTYAHRLAYLTSKVAGTARAAAPTTVTVIACAADAAEASRLLAMFHAQRHAGRRLILLSRETFEAPGADVKVLDPGSMQGLREAVASAAWVAVWTAADYYGPNYLTDLVLATRYGAAEALGKAAFHDGESGTIELRNDGAQYRPMQRLDARASMVRGAWLAQRMPAEAAALAGLALEGGEFLSIDEFNYCRNASGLNEADLAIRVDDEPGWAQGVSLDADLLPLAEGLRANTSNTSNDGDARALPGKSADELAALLPRTLPSGLSIRLDGGLLEVRSRLAADVHRYVYLSDTFDRAALNLETNSRFQLVAEDVAGGGDLRTVFEFLDEDKRKIGHAMSKAGAAQSMAIPARCRFVRFGLRVQGPVSARIRRLVLADLRERPSAVVPTARHLLVTKQYPGYDDLYRYGFVHSRVRGYRRDGLLVDIFRLHADEPCAFREFEDVDVVQGDRDLLDLTLRSGRHQHVLVHLLDAQMWEALARHVDRVKITVWVHGAEIQTWQRRAFELDGQGEAEVARRKALSDQRAAFWQRLLGDPHPNLSLVFVSQYVADEARRDLGLDLSRVSHQVIHNFIDGELFAYRAKDEAQRTHILSIRPFASRVYANDLTVRAIQLLSERPCFASLSFHIVGDGELFDETTRPLAGLPNVTLHKGFLTQREIAALHRENGIFLCPTRMDTQGVSRDEAMASGLVPVTMRVAAVPEFVDDTCGVLVDAEDAGQLADAVEALQMDPQRFLRLSQAAAARVRRDSGVQQTIVRELDWLRR